MAVKDIGIIFNGATGRIGATQHLANALAPIRAEGGLRAGPDRIVPRNPFNDVMFYTSSNDDSGTRTWGN